MRSEVQLLPGPPELVGGLSSAGRAVALQASGHRFDPDRLHQHCVFLDEDTSSASADTGGASLLFDIVNGFLKIDAVKVSALSEAAAARLA